MKKKNLYRGPWERDDLRKLKKLFPKYSTADVAEELGRPTEATKKRASRLGLKKSKKYMRKLGRK